MTFIVKHKKDLSDAIDRGRCIVCGELGSTSKRIIVDKIESFVILCSPDCEDELDKIMEE